MIAAANLRLLGRFTDAIRIYGEALDWDRRPELYLQLGLSQLSAKQREKAFASFRTAVRFNPKVVHRIEDVEARWIAYQQISLDQAALDNLLRNPKFTVRRRNGATGPFSGSGQGPMTVAAEWYLYNTQPGSVRCERLSTTRPGGHGQMLHVSATSSNSGLLQVWAPLGTGPPHAITSAWVFVNRGGVYIGSGRLATVSADASTFMTGSWHRIQGRAQSCPVNQTVIFSATSDADFYVADVEVRATEVSQPLPCEPVEVTLTF